jgi:hypothetical protein
MTARILTFLFSGNMLGHSPLWRAVPSWLPLRADVNIVTASHKDATTGVRGRLVESPLLVQLRGFLLTFLEDGGTRNLCQLRGSSGDVTDARGSTFTQ